MSETVRLIAETADRLFADHAEAARAALDRGAWPAPLWSAFETAGLADAMIASDDAETGLAAGFAVLRAAGRNAAPSPLAETLIARRLLDAAGIDPPSGPLTLAVATGEPTLQRVPWARHADALALISDTGETADIALIKTPNDHVSPGVNLADEPRDDIGLDGLATNGSALPVSSIDVMRLAAAARAAELRGAMEHVLALSVQYAGERKQFGRSIARFQAIQHHLAAMAGHVASSGAAVDAAAESGGALALATAKAETSAAAGEVATIAHQVHGAIGFTHEHTLHHWTKRLWAWREEWGNEARWWADIGRQTARAGSDALWTTLLDS